MIKVTIYKDKDNLITGFKVLGHAGYGQEGNDVVYAAVSALVINTINSIEYFTLILLIMKMKKWFNRISPD